MGNANQYSRGRVKEVKRVNGKLKEKALNALILNAYITFFRLLFKHLTQILLYIE